MNGLAERNPGRAWRQTIKGLPHRSRFPTPDPQSLSRAFLPYNPQAMLSKDLLEMLVCPACKMDLEYRQTPESLKCSQCHRVYAVRDGLPIMLIEEATVEA